MNVPFLDLRQQYRSISIEIEPLILKFLAEGSYIGGKYVNNFEKEFAEYLDVNHAIGCGNGTDAIMLALRACGIGIGDEVITSPFTFFATAEAIASIGAKPVFVDIKKNDYNIDPDKIESAITDKTKAILPVHIFGAPADMDSIMEIAKKHMLWVIEDAAQAVGSIYHGKKAGSLGDIACFSFYPTKNLGCCGDGGMVTTNNNVLATNVRALREHGAGKNGAKALENLSGKCEDIELTENKTELYDPYKYYNYLVGYNSRLDAIQACILSVKLRNLDEFNARRSRIAKLYMKKLTDKIILPTYEENFITCWHQFVILVDCKNEFCRYLSDNDIGNGSFYPIPLHKQKAFNKNNCANPNEYLPIAEDIASKSVCLPIYPEMTDEQVQYVIDKTNKFFEIKYGSTPKIVDETVL